MSIRVFHADDSSGYRSLIRACLADDEIEVVGEAGDRGELIAGVTETRPDVVLLDQLCGAEAIAVLRAAAPAARLIVLSGHAPDDGDRALAAAADGYVVKGADIDELRAAVRG